MKVSLAAMRINARMTQKKVAREIGVTPVTLGKWEKYETPPKTTQLMLLCNLYKCSTDDIFLPDKLAKSE